MEEKKLSLKNRVIYKPEKSTLDQASVQVLQLQNFINYLYNGKTIINDKKFLKVKEGLNLDLSGKIEYEKVISYFIDKILEGKLKKKINSKFLEFKFFDRQKNKIVSVDLQDEQAFIIKNNKCNFVDNFNNKFVVEEIQENEKITSGFYEKLSLLLKEKEEIQACYKEKVASFLDCSLASKRLQKKILTGYYKQEQKSLNRINIQVKRISEKLSSKYDYLID